MTDIAEEYRTILDRAGWFDLSRRGRIELDGPDALTFLQALVSNDVANLRPHEGRYATYLTPQGRMIGDLEVLHRGDVLLLDVSPDQGAALAQRLDGVIFSENVVVRDASAHTAEFAVVGLRAAYAVGLAIGADPEAVEQLTELAQVSGRTGFAFRSGDAGTVPMFRIVIPRTERAATLDRLASVPQISAALMEFLRIDAARPAFGVDMTEETIPLEAGLLDRGISTSKGCYVGQEVIVRILHRGGGRVVKRLVKMEFDHPDALPAKDDRIAAGDRDAGLITSVARSPVSGRAVALGFVHRDFAEIGRQVSIGSSGATAKIKAFAA